MSGELPTNTGFDPTSIKGRGGILVHGGAHVIVEGGPGSSIQEVYGENQERPTVFASPGGVFATILTVPITTTTGRFIDIEASLGAVADGGEGATYVDAAMRLLIDGVSTGLGAGATAEGMANPEPFMSNSMTARVAVTAGPHSVALQWYVQSDAVGDKLLGLLNADLDGAAMIVREIA